MKKLNITTKRLADLLPAAWRGRAWHQEDLFAFEASVDELGVLRLPVWNERTGALVDGHELVRKLIDDGETKVKVIVVDFTEPQEKAAALRLNSLRARGHYTEGALAELLDEVRRADRRLYDALAMQAMEELTLRLDLAEIRDHPPQTRFRQTRLGGIG